MTDKWPLSELDLEILCSGGFPAERQKALLARVKADPVQAARLHTLQASNREILEDHPPDAVAKEVKRRLAERQWVEKAQPGWRIMTWVAAPTLAGLALLFIWTGILPQSIKSDGGGNNLSEDIEVGRIKGLDPRVRIYRKTAAGQEALKEGSAARPGDLLQLGIVAAGRGFGCLVSLDGKGAFTLHHPNAAGDSPAIKSDGEVLLEHSYELDDAPGLERFILVVSDQTFDVAKVMASLRAQHRALLAGKPVELGKEFQVSSLTLKKESP
jgi:hypothetical protein